jgi:hypothetical protein
VFDLTRKEHVADLPGAQCQELKRLDDVSLVAAVRTHHNGGKICRVGI